MNGEVRWFNSLLKEFVVVVDVANKDGGWEHVHKSTQVFTAISLGDTAYSIRCKTNEIYKQIRS